MILRLRTAVLAVASLSGLALSQTWSSCNPLHTTTCPADPALGMTINVDFTKGSVNSFAPSGGNPTYGSDGVTFTVAKSGDSPQLISQFYIMFGRVEIVMKAAPGKGIVSTLVLQSDTLDEIDLEWLGADGSEVQSNYFGKGQTTSYNRGQFHSNPGNQDGFHKYVVDWTDERIVWLIDGTAVRTLRASDAETNQYPQTPMQIKFGAWSGGDSSLPQGTIDWARGPTDYSKGPFSMKVKSIMVADYSTGKQYKYGDTSGSWKSIKAVDGEVNGNEGKAGSPTITATSLASSSLSPSVPAGIGANASPAPRVTGALPDGWVMRPNGKIVPIGNAVHNRPSLTLALGPLALSLLLAAMMM
ncbi:hypothetical protein MCOR25_003339 [Pyricularia grisea]|uniref:chitinase n=1 Tax=Pyricularia grisea TaxID=148305 RepID=A0A6P8B411_PYRGI|nr:hypothetical protein PgNI_06327 [Pyricularia grisea]KAI6373952.1 hypothetical protein MCOR25_003339 [Pyricularia grisea]TLD09980.1 hypothetical protein PgNI_06327 [Pyricularia grisea]